MFTKKHFYFLVIVLSIVSILLAACNGATTTSVSGSQSLSQVTRLAVGTLKLEGTDQAVTSAQAAELVTLWQAYQSLSANDTTAQAELDALVTQIQGTLTSQQLQAIQSMQLTSQSVAEEIQSLSANASVDSSSSAQTKSTSEQITSGNASGGPGDPGMGGMPGGDASITMGDPSVGTSVQSTPAATSQAQSSSQAAQVNPILLKALINLLETKVKAAG